MSAKPAAAVNDWLDKREASAYFTTLGETVSERYVLDLAKKGKLESREERDPESQQWRIVVSAESVRSMAAARKSPTLRVTRKPTAVIVGEDGAIEPAAPRKPREAKPELKSETSVGQLRDALLERFFAQSAPAPAPAAAKTWLTLDEGAEYTGLPASVLQGLIAAGTLPALDCGIRPGGRWRVKRADLDAIAGVYQQQSAITLPRAAE